jgi:hypothetical protein
MTFRLFEKSEIFIYKSVKDVVTLGGEVDIIEA